MVGTARRRRPTPRAAAVRLLAAKRTRHLREAVLVFSTVSELVGTCVR